MAATVPGIAPAFQTEKSKIPLNESLSFKKKTKNTSFLYITSSTPGHIATPSCKNIWEVTILAEYTDILKKMGLY